MPLEQLHCIGAGKIVIFHIKIQKMESKRKKGELKYQFQYINVKRLKHRLMTTSKYSY